MIAAHRSPVPFKTPKFTRWVFAGSGIYGIVTLLPMYLMEESIARNNPPAMTHPEFFYGFLGVALAWQVLFLIIARNPVQFRLAMLPSVLEKLGYGATALVLHFLGRGNSAAVVFGGVDVLLGVLFTVAFLRTPRAMVVGSTCLPSSQ